jgi:hypothetical protein
MRALKDRVGCDLRSVPEKRCSALCGWWRATAEPGLDKVPLIDAESWIALRKPPGAIVMIGESYIALEMSQAFRRLGYAVTILKKAAQLAEREDPAPKSSRRPSNRTVALCG